MRRLKTDEQRLDQLGVNYRSSALDDGTAARNGGWQPAQIKTELSPLEWDVTAKVTAAGKVNVNFDYTDGACGIDIAWVALLEDGQEISRDTHAGFAGSSVRASRFMRSTCPRPKPARITRSAHRSPVPAARIRTATCFGISSRPPEIIENEPEIHSPAGSGFSARRLWSIAITLPPRKSPAAPCRWSSASNANAVWSRVLKPLSARTRTRPRCATSSAR